MGILFRIEKLSKSFKNSEGKTFAVLNNINFSLPESGMFFIYGKSGCGKSTLLNIFEGLMKPTTGDIYYKGKSISKFKDKDLNKYLRNEIGIIFQSFNLINDMTVFENLELVLRIKQIENYKKIDIFLKKYNLLDLKDKKVSTLSGGEKQRVALIRALLNEPSVIFADEPTGNLDETNSYKLMQELKEISKKCLVIVVSHNKKMVDEFNDGYLNLVNDKEYLLKEIDDNKKTQLSEKYALNKGKKLSFISYVLNHNLRKDIFKNMISLISLIFSICVCFVFLGFNNGVKNNSLDLIKNYQNNNSYKISKIIYEQKNDSNLMLEKTEKPSLEEIESMFNKYENVDIHNSIDYFFGETNETRIENELIKNVSYIPINNSSLNNIVYINENFDSSYKKEHNGKSLINKNINLHLKRSYMYKNTFEKGSSIIKEDFIMYISFYVKEIKEEFSYLNYPKVYFSINYFEKLLNEHFCNNIYKETNKKISYLELLKSAQSNSELGNYSYQVFLDNFQDMVDFNKKIKKYEDYKIINEPYNTITSFMELSSSLVQGLIFFIIIVIASSISLISFLSYSLFIFNRKQSAILTILGANNDKIFLIYIYEQIIIGLISCLFSFILLPYIQGILNKIIEKYTFFSNLIMIPHNFKISLLFLIVVLFLIFIFVTLPLVLSKNNEIYKELKEE